MKKCLAIMFCILLLCAAVIPVSAELTDLHILMVVDQRDNGTIIASLDDDRGGTVSNWPVSLEIDGDTVETVNTDENGDALFDYDIPGDATQIACVAHSGEYDVYRFVGCTVYLEEFASTTTTDITVAQATTTTASSPEEKPVVGDAVSTTDVLVVAQMTTMVDGGRVAVGVDANEAFVNASQLTSSDIADRSRMWMDNALYSSLVSSSDATIHLELGIDSDAGQNNILIAAKNADPAYASYDDSEVKGFAATMTLVYVDENSRVPLEIEDGMYNVELPVPQILKDSETIAIAVCTADGLASFIEVKPVGGMLKFTVQRFQTLAIVGFGNAGVSVGSLVETPWLLTLVIVIGVLLIAGGILLLIFVAFRKNKNASVMEDDGDDGVRHTLITPTANEELMFVDIEKVAKDEVAKTVLVDYDEHMNLTEEQREQYRAKAPMNQDTFDCIAHTSVSPAKQIGRQQMEAIAEEAAMESNSCVTVDELMDELMSDLEQLDSK